MKLTCPACQREVEFPSERPLYCPWCGKPLPPPSTVTPVAQQKLVIAGSTGPFASDSSLDSSLPSTLAGQEANTPENTLGLQLSLGDYRIIRRIGSGGMGTVYEGIENTSGRPVAIKIMKPGLADTPGAIERFRQEGRLASLIAHPRCVFVFKADEEAGSPYIVMERMPGATLKDLVSQQGPLPPPVAVAKILDVIDGLIEAHNLGVIHRDVKPSNCFLMPDGRVKIGDFGLSKFVPPAWQEAAAHRQELTRSGMFLGTPLYASPEQIRGEAVDFRTDVYSVAATLFFLLTGQAPHATNDPTQAVARIVSEPPQSPRQLRPEIPHALEKVLLTGLERQRERRWQSLEEFRDALLPFVPGEFKPALRLPRLRAFLIDGLVLLPVLLLLAQIVERVMPFSKHGWMSELARDTGFALLTLLYFGFCEGATGQTVGKWLLRLKVRSIRWGHAAGKRQTLIRVLLFFTITALAGRAVYYLTPLPWLSYLFNVVGILVIVDTMRLGNNYRGLHDLASRTVVVQLPWPRRKLKLAMPDGPPLRPRPRFIPEKIGVFQIRGVVRIKLAETILAGDDPVLERQVWLTIHPAQLPETPAVRREITRPTRLRWLASGELSLPEEHRSEAARAWAVGSSTGRVDALSWDAYLAAEGCPLPEAIPDQGLSWAEARPLVEQLTDELVAGLADGTLPDELEPDYVWLRPGGNILLIGSTFAGGVEAPARRQKRALTFLGRIVRRLLEGGKAADRPGEPLAAPLPAHARTLLDPLVGVGPPHSSVDEFQRRLKETADAPASMTVGLRLSLLGLSALVLAPILLAMFVLGRYYREIEPTVRLTNQIRRAERVLRWLEDPRQTPQLRRALEPRERLYVLSTRGPLDFLVAGDSRWLSAATQDELFVVLAKVRLREQLDADRRSLQGLRRLLALAFLPDVVNTLIDWTRKPPESPEEERALRLRELRGALLHAQGRKRTDFIDEGDIGLLQRIDPLYIAWGSIAAWLLLWTVLAAVTRGGISSWLMGLDLVRNNGKPAAWWQAALRTLLAWLPIVLLLGGAVLLQHDHPSWLVWPWVLWWLAVLLLGVYVIAALLSPERLAHDRLLGVQLMPR